MTICTIVATNFTVKFQMLNQIQPGRYSGYNRMLPVSWY